MDSISKIISGGQTGVDRAALDFALHHNIIHGGWCPKGRLAEDGRIPDKFNLQETPSDDYSQRTEWNLRDSDGTIIIFDEIQDEGSLLTTELAGKLYKPLINLNLAIKTKPAFLIQWIKSNEIKTLNIAGPRESNSLGIYKKTMDFLNKLL